MARRVMPRMNSDGYFCVVLIADVRHMSKNRCLWQRFCEWDGRVLNSYKKIKNVAKCQMYLILLNIYDISAA